MNDKPENELTDDVVVMSLGIIDNAGWHAEVIMIDQRRQQHRDRDEYMGPHGWLPSPPSEKSPRRRRRRPTDGLTERPLALTETKSARQRGTIMSRHRSILILN